MPKKTCSVQLLCNFSGDGRSLYKGDTHPKNVSTICEKVPHNQIATKAEKRLKVICDSSLCTLSAFSRLGRFTLRKR